MKVLLVFPLALALSGCASYYAERHPAYTTQTDTVVYEPAGAAIDPNPNWDINARDLHQRPYRPPLMIPWGATAGAAGTYGGVHTSTDTEKNIGPQIRPQDQLP